MRQVPLVSLNPVSREVANRVRTRRGVTPINFATCSTLKSSIYAPLSAFDCAEQFFRVSVNRKAAPLLCFKPSDLVSKSLKLRLNGLVLLADAVIVQTAFNPL
jgi:hypothetical protein